MTKATNCMRDTLFLLLERARAAKAASLAMDPATSQIADQAFAAAEAEALMETLHTWFNQLRTFELEEEIGDTYVRIRDFLAEAGFPT